MVVALSKKTWFGSGVGGSHPTLVRISCPHGSCSPKKYCLGQGWAVPTLLWLGFYVRDRTLGDRSNGLIGGFGQVIVIATGFVR